MEQENIISLTNKIYNLTLLFPKKEPLRYKIREVGDEILKGIIEWDVLHSHNPVRFLNVERSEKEKVIINLEKNFNILKGYFAIFKRQNWVSFFDILEIEKEYNKIEEEIKIKANYLYSGGVEKENSEKKEKIPLKKAKQEKSDNFTNLNERQEKIIDFLKKNSRSQVWQIKNIFPDISKRTLRRDFEQLLRKGIIKRKGERNNTFYELV